MRSRSFQADDEQDWGEDGDSPSRWGSSLWRKLAGDPKEAIALSLALVAAVAVVVNALFLQSGPHPAPIFSTRLAPAKASETTGSVPAMLPRPRPTELDGARADPPAAPAAPAARVPARSTTGAAAAAVPREDPIALLLAPSKRVLAVQRTLAEYGYGQIAATGIEDRTTAAAIRKFERAHKLPVNGRVSDRFVRELALITGRSFD